MRYCAVCRLAIPDDEVRFVRGRGDVHLVAGDTICMHPVGRVAPDVPPVVDTETLLREGRY